MNMATFRKRNDKWEYRISYKDPITNDYKVKSKTGFKTKQEAKVAATEMEKSLKEGFEQGDMPLVAYLKEWLDEYKKSTIRKNTYEIHLANITNRIAPYFKNITLKNLKPIMYQKFLNSYKDKYSKNTIEKIHATMHQAMEKAVVLQKIETNPCKGVTIPGIEKDNRIVYMESEHIPLFLKTAYKYNYIYYIFFKTLLETGMRKGEAAALQWSDIDFKEGTININKTLHFQAKDKEELFGDTKTYNSVRTITMSKSLTNDLLNHLRWQNENKINLNDIYFHDLNLVFTRNDGYFLPKSTLFNAFSRILKQAEIPNLNIHSLRHTHAVLLLESGASMKYVQERLGHGSMQITSDVYAHISKKIEKDTLEKFEAYTENLLKQK